MVDILKKATEKQQESEEVYPEWVSTKNKSYEAYHCLMRLRNEKKNYIKNHRLVTDYRLKSSYQISGSDVAREISIAPASLTATSSYSEGFKTTLKEVNQELENLKSEKLAKSNKKDGVRQEKKDDLVARLRQAEAELEAEQKRNTSEIAQKIRQDLPLPLQRKLGLV